MPFDLRATLRRKPSKDSNTVECWRCGGNHWYRDRKTGRKCEAEPTYDAERQKRFQSEHKEGEQKSSAAAAGTQQLSFAAVAAGGMGESQVRALKQSNEQILAEVQAQRAASDALRKSFEQMEKALQAAVERGAAAEKAAQEALLCAAAAEKRADEAEKRAEAAQKRSAEACQRVDENMDALILKIERNDQEFDQSLKTGVECWEKREKAFCASFQEWQKEWERKFACLRALAESKQSEAKDGAAASIMEKRAGAAEKRAEAAEKRAEAAEKAAAGAGKRAAEAEKLAKEVKKNVATLEDALGDAQHGFLSSVQLTSASFAQRESEFIKSTTAELETWKREWQRKIEVMHKVAEAAAKADGAQDKDKAKQRKTKVASASS